MKQKTEEQKKLIRAIVLKTRDLRDDIIAQPVPARLTLSYVDGWIDCMDWVLDQLEKDGD